MDFLGQGRKGLKKSTRNPRRLLNKNPYLFPFFGGNPRPNPRCKIKNPRRAPTGQFPLCLFVPGVCSEALGLKHSRLNFAQHTKFWKTNQNDFQEPVALFSMIRGLHISAARSMLLGPIGWLYHSRAVVCDLLDFHWTVCFLTMCLGSELREVMIAKRPLRIHLALSVFPPQCHWHLPGPVALPSCPPSWLVSDDSVQTQVRLQDLAEMQLRHPTRAAELLARVTAELPARVKPLAWNPQHCQGQTLFSYPEKAWRGTERQTLLNLFFMWVRVNAPEHACVFTLLDLHDHGVGWRSFVTFRVE